MKLILVPGFWLDARSWDDVAASLRDTGHTVVALTMPGVGEPASSIGISTWVDAVVAEIDASAGPVVLVGHSGGGNVVWGAADARPADVARVIFVDSAPPAPGASVMEFPVLDGIVPFPGWDFFPAEDVADLDDATRQRAGALMSSIPAAVPTAPLVLTNPARFTVPVTLLMGGFDSETFDAFVREWKAYADEYFAILDREVVRIGSAHWPQFSVPHRLAALIADAVR